jgi:Tfp pilus assembly protein PilO
MKASAKRALSLLLSGALMVASLIVFGTLVRPEYEIVLQLRNELASQSNLLIETQGDISRVQSLKAQYQNSERIIGSLNSSLPEQELIANLMSQINAISQSSGIATRSIGISYLPVRPSAVQLSFARGVGTLRLDLLSVGSYSSLKRFLQLLETNVRVMDVNTLSLDVAASPTQDVYNYSITVDTYYQGQ